MMQLDKMKEHRVTTRQSDVTHYFHSEQLYKSAWHPEYGDRTSAMMQKCHTAYDHKRKEFVKERGGKANILNAMLLVARNRSSISDEMRELVEKHK